MRRVLALVAFVLLAGCNGALPPTTTTTTPTTPGPPPELAFSGASAYAFAEEQVTYPNGSLRYRVPGTAGNDEAAALIAGHLAASGWSVAYDHFNASYRCETTPLHNVVGERVGTSGRLVVVGAHYDTRPVSEKDPDPAKRGLPVPGANDGASGVAVLLELARVLPPTPDTVRLVFFDAEDGGDMGDGCTDWLLGSRHYVETLGDDAWREVQAMVLVDMVGDPDLVLPRERLSDPKLQDRVYAIAGSLGYASVFTNDTRRSAGIEDDHVPFKEAGIPALDLIHLVGAPSHFPAWHHTTDDTLEHVSAASLEVVGRTLEAWLRAGAPAS